MPKRNELFVSGYSAPIFFEFPDLQLNKLFSGGTPYEFTFSAYWVDLAARVANWQEHPHT
jgi:hypothetical protein